MFLRFCQRVGRPLEPFQERIAEAVFGDAREVVALLPKGNAKSGLGALLAVHELLHVPGAYVLLGAGSREQALPLFEACRSIAEHRSVARHLLVRHLELRGPRATRLRVVASDGKRTHGPTPSLSICDEMWAHRDDGLYTSMRAALPKREDAKLVVLSTAPRSLDTPLGRLRARVLAGEASREGVVTDARRGAQRLLEWSLVDEAEADDDELLRQCNPATWISMDSLVDQREASPRASFLQFTCNMPGVAEGQAFPPGAWAACAGSTSFTEGERVWLGIDMGGARSDSALVVCNEAGHVAAEVFEGARAVPDVQAAVDDYARRFEVAEIVFDPWHAGALVSEWETRGLTTVEWPQTDQRMAPASQRVYDAVIERRLVHDGHEKLAQHVANAVQRVTRRGWRFDKPAPDVKIDALIALVMCWDRMENRGPASSFVGWV